jgi:hypothetical protein
MNEHEAAALSHVNIQQNNVRQWWRCNSHEGLFQRVRKDGIVAFGFQPMLEEFTVLGIIVHHQNPPRHPIFL